MSLEEVKKEILAYAEAEAKKTRETAKKEAEALIKKAEQDAKEQAKQSEDETKQLAQNIEKKELASARSEAKKLILDEKKSILDEVMDEAKKKLAILPEKKREQMIQNLLEKAKKEIKVKTVYASLKDKKFIREHDFKEKAMLGGIIAESADEKIRVDYSFEQLLEEAKARKMQDTAKGLW